MKKHLLLQSALVLWAFLLISSFLFDEAQSDQLFDENQTVLQDPATQGTPDPNNSFVWPIELFAENINPLQNGWDTTGGGQVQRVEEPTGSKFYFMRATTSNGLTFKVQYPKNGMALINSQKKHIVFSFRSTSTFALEVRIKIKTPGDTLKDKIIRYLPEDSSNYLVGDTLIVIAVGSAYKSSSFKTLNCKLEADLQTFFPTYKFQALNLVYARGQVDLSAVQTWNRYFFIEGYADSSSIKQSNPIGFKISLGDSVDTTIASNKNYHIEIYRVGAAGQNGLELKKTFSSQAGVNRLMRQDGNPAYEYGTDWPTTDNVLGSETVNWKSGVYLAKFIHDATGRYTWYPFVVREDNPGSTSKILVQISNNTSQAYNFWGGKSFYSAPAGGWASFDRPYLSLWFNPEHKDIDPAGTAEIQGLDSLGASHFFAWEFSFVKWLEGEGYVAEYTDNVYLHRDKISGHNFLTKYHSFFSLGHDEYWSREMRLNIESDFRNQSRPKDPDPQVRIPHNLAFLSGNTCFWRITYDTTQPPASNLLTRKIFTNYYPDKNWHDPVNGVKRPDSNRTWYEQELIGARTSKGFDALGKADTVTVLGASHWTFGGAGLAATDSFGYKNSSHPYGISGYETHVIVTSSENCADGLNEDAPDGLTYNDIKLLAGASPSALPGGSACKSQVTYYEYIVGGTLSKVFNGGAVQWTWGLDNIDDPTRKITKNLVDGLTSTFVGHITQNMTWSGNIYLGGDVTIDAGITVTINPGTKIYFFPNNDVERTGGNSTKTELVVKGTLTCLGSQTDSIIFTSASTTPVRGDWGGVRVPFPGNGDVAFTRFSYADTALSVSGDTATVIVYNSTFTHFNKAAVYSKGTKTRLGGIFPLPVPPDCGKNNFLMNTASSGAKAVIKSPVPSGTLKAEGNWWTQAPPQSSWFSGNVDRTPYLLGYATPDSCGGNQPLAPPPGKVTARSTLPLTYELGQNYPNPFNPTATIEYALPEPAKVELKVFNILGQVVRTLVDEHQGAGYHQAVWNGKDESGRTVSTGIYLYQIRAGDFVKTLKMSFIK